jgi:hypothetical protein
MAVQTIQRHIERAYQEFVRRYSDIREQDPFWAGWDAAG